MKQGKVGSKWSQEKHRKILPLRAKWPLRNKKDQVVHNTRIPCGMSVRTLQTAEKPLISLKRGGGVSKASLGKPQEQNP